jgi:hypothetical protein
VSSFLCVYCSTCPVSSHPFSGEYLLSKLHQPKSLSSVLLPGSLTQDSQSLLNRITSWALDYYLETCADPFPIFASPSFLFFLPLLFHVLAIHGMLTLFMELLHAVLIKNSKFKKKSKKFFPVTKILNLCLHYPAQLMWRSSSQFWVIIHCI